ncbi:hypothetical protein AJ78_08077 [Emergomyces pasteurianus Ep9510]|uniref:Uncharacterized protein n=1 Tax=Emergomyces pasteurianus Ep9510 TaxID=1447872 RepID=A0A1J9Q7D9_9EURO|nr:hypothetical protein AJ78_08077 [Emergomyces pasteurianus Ep9510]
MPNPKSPKTMSSRLLTMKFMQRAAAASAYSNPNSNTSTNAPASPTPSTQQQQQQQLQQQQQQHQTYDAIKASIPSPKRQKLSSPSTSTPSTPFTGNTDLEAISAAIRAEEEKRAAAIAKQAAEAGEEEWVIEYPPGTFPEPSPQAAMNGGNAYVVGDAGDEEVIGRQSFGGFKRKGKMGVPMAATSASHDADDDEDEENGDERGSGDDAEQDDDGLDALVNNAKLKAEKKWIEKHREQHNKHNKKRRSSGGAVDLSRLTSISGGVGKGEQQRQHQRHQNSGSGRRGRR